ncbi:hypothetical protein [Bacillus suaedae]|uniref:TIGR04222 domain-containing membrane protein n=1 Tax=Halalkalibacter suaedae TaxID=2822140 RepID=A0A941APV7_9BACI|nr:hypothetical protein [Bacillus suaedae]MBP3950518.1 hypothetical protein [Bacillus suaedae]
MEGFFVIALIIIIIFIVKLIGKQGKSRNRQLKNESIPSQVDIQLIGSTEMVQSLETALSNTYVENVKNRLLSEHPNWADHEVDWMFFELKRYFLMNGLLKSVPMFSEKVDIIWHEMLMFTREYQTFSNEFYGETLHHRPNLDSKPIPEERAFFDWVYVSLFDIHDNSRAIWGSFFKNPIKLTVLEDFQHLSNEKLLMKYFRNNDQWLEVKEQLIYKMKNEIKHAQRMKLGQMKPKTNSDINSFPFHALLSAAVFYSMYETESYQEEMGLLMPKEFKEQQGSGSSCSGFACSASSDSDGDSGGSSCSSCSGGCSS